MQGELIGVGYSHALDVCRGQTAKMCRLVHLELTMQSSSTCF